MITQQHISVIKSSTFINAKKLKLWLSFLYLKLSLCSVKSFSGLFGKGITSLKFSLNSDLLHVLLFLIFMYDSLG